MNVCLSASKGNAKSPEIYGFAVGSRSFRWKKTAGEKGDMINGIDQGGKGKNATVTEMTEGPKRGK